MEKDIILRAEDLHQLNLVLTTILDSAQAELIMIINKSGRLITWQGETSTFDTISIAALITGSTKERQFIFAASNAAQNFLSTRANTKTTCLLRMLPESLRAESHKKNG